MEKEVVVAPIKPLQGLIALVLVIVGVAAYLTIGGLLGIVPLYAGFAFSLYFGGIKHSAPAELLPSVLGALGGVAVAAMLALLPEMLGTAGLAIALGAIALSIYCLIMNWVTVVVNYAFMLMLTIATIAPVAAQRPFVGMAEAIILAGALMGALILIGGLVAKRKDKAAASAPGG